MAQLSLASKPPLSTAMDVKIELLRWAREFYVGMVLEKTFR